MLKTMKILLAAAFLLAGLSLAGCKKTSVDAPIEPAEDLGFCQEAEAADFKTAEEFKTALLGKWQLVGEYSREISKKPSYKLRMYEIRECEYRADDSLYIYNWYSIELGDTIPLKPAVIKYNIGLTPLGKIGLYMDVMVMTDRKKRVYYYLCKDGQTLVQDFTYSGNNYTDYRGIEYYIYYLVYKRKS